MDRDAELRDGRVISQCVVYLYARRSACKTTILPKTSIFSRKMDNSERCPGSLERSLSQAELEFEDFLREEEELQKKRYKPQKAKNTIHPSDYKYKLGEHLFFVYRQIIINTTL